MAGRQLHHAQHENGNIKPCLHFMQLMLFILLLKLLGRSRFLYEQEVVVGTVLQDGYWTECNGVVGSC
jgi:hypothetical protein